MTGTDYDVGIIGGGPAGSSMAGYLAKAGMKCVVFESEVFPRPHVGESLVPSSTRVFEELGLLEKMEKAGFPRKYGAAWTSSRGKVLVYEVTWHGWSPREGAQIRFNERKQPGVDLDYTYHVDRGRFDHLLLQHAEELGAEIRQGVSVSGVDFSGKLPVILTKDRNGTAATPVRLVVDASGRRTVLGNQLRLKVKDPIFDQYAIHTWFEGYDRKSVTKGEAADYILVHFVPISNSWLWQIPISESVTSVGVVTQKRNLAPTREGREAFFWNAAGTRPEILSALHAAKQLRPFKEEGDYSYAMKQLAGDRFILIGDAARFVDPIFSTGVSIALNSARFASRDAIAALGSGDLSRKSFQQYETTLLRGTRNWYEFITLYYRLNVLFTWFINQPEYRLDLLKLLQGDVYDEEKPEVLRKMEEMVLEVEQNESHIWHGLLGELTCNAFRPG